MIVGIGNDLCDVRRIKEILVKYDYRFKNRCFTKNEIKKCDSRLLSVACYAKRFAAKEACSKALGTGIKQGVFFKDMEVVNLISGKPTLKLSGNAKNIMRKLIPRGKYPNILLTITDDMNIANALVVIEAVDKILK